MSNFVPNVTIETDFDGDKVKVVSRRLRRLEMLKIIPGMTAIEVLRKRYAKVKKSEVTQEMTNEVTEAALNVLETCEPIFATAIITLEGLAAADGSPVDVQTVMREMYFMDLALKIITQVVDASSTGPDEGKG